MAEHVGRMANARPQDVPLITSPLEYLALTQHHDSALAQANHENDSRGQTETLRALEIVQQAYPDLHQEVSAAYARVEARDISDALGFAVALDGLSRQRARACDTTTQQHVNSEIQALEYAFRDSGYKDEMMASRRRVTLAILALSRQVSL